MVSAPDLICLVKMLSLSTNFDIIYNVDVLLYWASIFEFNDNISTRIV
jgi:hypothetical protein